MPPKSAQAGNKRAHEETGEPVNPSAPQAKKPAVDGADAAGPSTGPVPDTASRPLFATSYGRRMARGPNGEIFIPQMLPVECKAVVEKLPIPGSWFAGLDATPDRSMTLGSREWWEDNGLWLDINKSKLKIKAKDWKKKEEALKKPATIKEDEGNADWDFICLPVPDDDDDEDEYDEEEEEEEDDEAGPSTQKAAKDNSMVGKLAFLHPDHPYIVSMLGWDRYQYWQMEALKRCPDDFSMHVYNDYGEYGKLEVIENIFIQFDKLLEEQAVGYRQLWSELEGLVLALRGDELDFTMCDDSTKCGEIIEMIGHLALITMDTLEKQGALSPGSDIPNLGFIFATLVQWAWDITSDFDQWWGHGGWILPVIDRAREHNITLGGPAGFSKLIQEIDSNRQKGGKKFMTATWASKLKAFKDQHGGRTGPSAPAILGGTHYDITMMRDSERTKYSYM